MADDSRKSELIAELSRRRVELTLHSRAARREMEYGRRFQESFRRHAPAWLAAAAILGLLITLPRRRRKVVVKPLWRTEKPEEKVVKAGLALTVLKIGFDLVRPALTKWVTGQVSEYAKNRVRTARAPRSTVP